MPMRNGNGRDVDSDDGDMAGS
ncbi:protein of unknown function [Kyrpidia spormannii]|uniref:Uncharacterized protein n=1 Tax=Kyrpidia spormannii TaxID=2055160 RepID=A0A6F9EGJ5_9BACL|nr:protein of unknown function [Kyrpidia spormannii]